jgi:hypothetical protein
LTGGQSNLAEEESNIIRKIKSRMMGLAGHAESTRWVRNYVKPLTGKAEGKRSCERDRHSCRQARRKSWIQLARNRF